MGSSSIIHVFWGGSRKIDNLRMRASTKMSRQAADIDDPAVMQIEDKRA